MNAQAQNPIRPARLALFAIIAIACTALAHLADHSIPPRITDHAALEIESAEFSQLLRMVGYVPTWIIIGIALVLIDRRRELRPPLRDMWTRGVLLVSAALLSGLAAEALKLVARRLRPDTENPGEYLFRAFSDGPLNSSGLGLPSSHTAVAFGAAFALTRLHPQAWPVWLALATGCGATRVLTRAHYLSDAVASAFLGAAVAWVLWRAHLAVVARSSGNESGGS